MKKTNSFFALACASLLSMGLASCGETPTSSSTSPSTGFAPSTIIEGEKICIHYSRTDNNYTGWDLWVWQEGIEPGVGVAFNGQDSYGAYALFALGDYDINQDLGFIVRKGGESWTAKDPDGDRFLKLSTFTKEDDTYNVYLKSGSTGIYKNIAEANSFELSEVKFLTTKKLHFKINAPISSYYLFEEDNPTVHLLENTELITSPYVNNEFTNITIDFNKTYKVTVNWKNADPLGSTTDTEVVSISELFDSDEFNSALAYDGQLGPIYSSSETTFRIWAPTSTAMSLNLYKSGTPTSLDATNGSDEKYQQPIAMTKGEKGVFETTVSGDLHGYYFTYDVTNSLGVSKDVVDPYAIATGINGLRGEVLDLSKTNPDGWNDVEVPQISNTQLSVYELHVADLTSSSTWNGTPSNAKKYAGLIETGTAYKGVKTGFDHIKDLGVNAVQLLPIFDQDNDERPEKVEFNWGYNPKNYNVIEGCYSNDPYNGATRIKEMKEVVKAYAKENIKIIMDVVYNHVSSLSSSNFNKLVPEYYFRYNSSGPSDGSGCGNETASENKMMSKFMIDSTKFLASEYKLGGFRFDLMGLHDVDTMNNLYDACAQINPTITIYGEPWTGGDSALNKSKYKPAIQDNAGELLNVGTFSDVQRDAIKSGGLSSEETPGWISNVSGGTSTQNSRIYSAAAGLISSAKVYNSNPANTVNYVSCHDNSTLFDKLYDSALTLDGSKLSDEELAALDVASNAFVFTSQGISFMQAGEEMLREKRNEAGEVDTNSYESSYEINELDYSKLTTETGAKVYDSYKKLINLKTTVSNFQLNNKATIKTAVIKAEQVAKDKNVISYVVKGETADYLIAIANRVGSSTFDLPAGSIEILNYLSDAKGVLSSTNTLVYQGAVNSFDSLL